MVYVSNVVISDGSTAPVEIVNADGSTKVEEWEIFDVDGVRCVRPPDIPYCPPAGATIRLPYPMYISHR